MPNLGYMDAARRDDTSIFRLHGEFDLSNAWKIQEALLQAIRSEERDVVVDLSEVTFMDAQLVRALIKARSLAIRRDVAFVVVPPRDQVVSHVAGLIDFDRAA
jgi:anti-anti-sigma factor